jgi:hypothetical protein
LRQEECGPAVPILRGVESIDGNDRYGRRTRFDVRGWTFLRSDALRNGHTVVRVRAMSARYRSFSVTGATESVTVNGCALRIRSLRQVTCFFIALSALVKAVSDELYARKVGLSHSDCLDAARYAFGTRRPVPVRDWTDEATYTPQDAQHGGSLDGLRQAIRERWPDMQFEVHETPRRTVEIYVPYNFASITRLLHVATEVLPAGTAVRVIPG